MKHKKLLVLFIIIFLIVNITIVSAAESKNKKNEDKDKEKNGPKEDEETDSQGQPSDKNGNDKEKPSKDNKDKEKPSNGNQEKEEKDAKETKDKKEKTEKDETKNNKPEKKPGAYSFPYELHGPGKGKIKNDQEWSGDVWAHYDYNDYFGVWEVGIEGLTEDGDTAWYAFELVTNEVFENNKLTASASFIDEPFNGLEFTYEANLNSMHWTIKGKGFHFTGTIVDYSFRDQQDTPLPEGYSTSVFWRGLTWNSLDESIRVTPDDYLESLVYSGEAAFWGEAFSNTPEEFYTASDQWIRACFMDEGDGQPGAGIGLRWGEDFLYIGGLELTHGEESWQGDYPDYVIYWESDSGSKLVDTGFSREAGEHNIHLIRNTDGSLDCWVDWCYVTSFSDFGSEMFSQISLLGNYDAGDLGVSFTDFEWSTGSPYMDMPTDVEFHGVLDTFYCDPNVKIVESEWNATIRDDGTASFSCSFTELNIREDAPGDVVGGYDYFVISMSGDYVMDRLDGIYVIDDVMTWMKNGVPLSTKDTTVYIHPDDYGNQLVVVWNPDRWIFGSILPE